MPKPGKRKPNRKTKKKNSTLLLFAGFIVIALVTVVLLEYIDFRKSGKSFIFNKVVPLKKKTDNVKTFNTRLLHLLKSNNIPHDYFPADTNKYHFKMDINHGRYDSLIKKLKDITAGLKGKLELSEIQGLTNKSIMLYNVILEGRITHLLLISKFNDEKKKQQQDQEDPILPSPVPETKLVPQSNGPRIAFIIDDVGAYDIGPLELKRLGIPITASILPDSRRARECARWANEYQLETIIHLPMQPTNSEGMSFDRNKTITPQSTDTEIRALIRHARQVVPQAHGLNNHQGSLVTSNRDIMTRVLKIIREEKLFFIDSRTIGNSVAYDMARAMNIRTTQKDIFIDHVQTYSHSIEQIKKLVETARRKGKAVAIGHPFQSTISAIRDSISYIKSSGVKIVLVKQLLE